MTSDLAAARLPDPEQCVIPLALRRRAKDRPEHVFAVFEDGTTWDNATAHVACENAAAGLASLGVSAGDRVLCWLPNGREVLQAWFGANRLGAIYVPINTSYRGGVLAHVIRDSAPRVAVIHSSLLDRLTDIDTCELEHIIVVGDAPPCSLPGITLHSGSLLAGAGADALPECPAKPWDPYAIIYTSGTTGPSKGVVSSYLHVWATATAVSGVLGADDRFLAHLPLFHAGGTIAVVGALALGGSVAVVSGFNTATFWQLVSDTGATAATVLGAMATFLMNQQPSPGDRDTPLRTAYIVPLTEDATAFADRFGCDVYTCFNMTEISVPLMSERNPRAVGTCGRPRPGVEVRLVDDHDQPVPDGQAGELIVRTTMPWTLNSGYWQNAAATAAAWRNGWFHTGDAFRIDADGNYYFVDRMKDAIRRRGENISSFEVETEVLAHPDIKEAAVVAVRSEVSEDDVLVIVAPVEGHTIDPEQLIEFLRPRMAHFMIPRYVRVLPQLPKTPTAKVEKHALRAQGITPDTWDREAAGIRVRAERPR